MTRLTVFAYPFRIFFLSLAIWAMVAVAVWVGNVTGVGSIDLALPPLQWHQHEMVFGLLSAEIAGFLLTAVCVWTGTERLHGLGLILLWQVWLLGRLLGLLPATPPVLLLTINLLFLPLVMLDAGRRILSARQPRQIPILLVLAVLWGTQAAFLFERDANALNVALVAASALMLIIGGRITPAFSGNWLRARGQSADPIRNPAWLDWLTLVAILSLCATLWLQNDALTGGLALMAGAISLSRILLWRGWRVSREPLLWILHVSLLWIPAGLFLLAGTHLADWPDNVWVHALGLGAMGGLMLGVMTRVSLGHTGRPLILPRGMAAAYLMIHASAVIRVLTAFGGLPWQWGIDISALLWLGAWALFLLRYAPILLSPRADGKPG